MGNTRLAKVSPLRLANCNHCLYKDAANGYRLSQLLVCLYDRRLFYCKRGFLYISVFLFRFVGAVRIFPSTDIYIEDKSRFNPISIYCFVPYKGDTTWKYNGNLRKHYSDWSKCENSKIRAFCKNYINIPTFHEDYVGRYTCCDLHEGTNASINVGGK